MKLMEFIEKFEESFAAHSDKNLKELLRGLLQDLLVAPEPEPEPEPVSAKTGKTEKL